MSISDDDAGISPSTTGVDITAPLMNVMGRVSRDGDIPSLKVESETASLVMRDGVDSGSNITASLDDIT